MTSIKAVWKEGMQFEADAPGGKIKLDAADDFGGLGKGNRSKPLMLVALAGCTGIDVVSILNKMQVPTGGFSLEVEAEPSDEHPKIYKKTHIVYRFKSDEKHREKIERAVDLSFNKYCGVVAMFKAFSVVTKEIVFEA